MHPFLIKRYAEKTALWTGLGALNAPLAFLPAMIAGHITYRHSTQSPERALRSAIHLGGFKPLESTSPLALMANEMGGKVGVTFTHLYKTDEKSFENVMILQDRRDEAALLFQGDPLQDLDLIEAGQEQQFLRGILAHELGHTHTRGTNYFQHNATITSHLYGLGAGVSMCIGWAAMLFGSFTTGVGFMGAATAGAVASTAALVLRSRNLKNDEYLADIHGAQIFGADDLIITHDFADKVLSPQIEQAKSAYKGRDTPGLMTRLYDNFIDATHPSSNERIDALRRIFKSKAVFNLVGEPVLQERFAPRPKSMRLQATRIEPKNDKPQ